ncbi:putative Zn-binding protein involved in type VI secretion [Microvirga lupini]|uniref:Putative Zn-binding protein involved in type VI secretion n=1 Tax=Microvirga lupini TaxID=420324 RepID=A0A7W4VI89_9HYPH|nr:PAAR domain-containing protein [Microvirga lupini]MBB3017718.1 putative Zn-binding protein involved in type VI secretion [Microvirga lupini]
MPGISRVGVDAAGGTIIGNLAPTVFINGAPCAVQGADVAPHPPFPPHSAAPVMVGHSSTVFACGIPVCRAGDQASCGHAATGSGNVFAGG